MLERIFHIVVLTALVCVVQPTPSVVRIGGLFGPGDSDKEVAFRYGVDSINEDQSILPRTRLVPHFENVPMNNSFKAVKQVCNILRQGVIGIFGPQSEELSNPIQSLCDTMEIPHFENHWQIQDTRESSRFNLYPHYEALSRALVDLVTEWEFESFLLIYENDDGIVRLQGLLKACANAKLPFIVRQLPEGNDYRRLLREIMHTGEKNIILDCSVDKIFDVMKQAQQVGMMTADHNYLVTSLNLHTVDLEDFQYSGTTIVGMRLVDVEDDDVIRTVRHWRYSEMRNGRVLNLSASNLRTETALMYDAVYLFSKSLHELDNSQLVTIKPFNCEAPDPWHYGYSLMNYMRVGEHRGLTGLIRFDRQGYRSDFMLDVVQLYETGLRKIGTWNSTEGTNFTDTERKVVQLGAESLRNKTMIVSTILNEPYTMLKERSERLTGNDQYEGFAIDLIHEISLILGFKYIIKLAADGQHGSYNETTNEWNGMIGDLRRGDADLALADLTITAARESAVEFTMPFMNLGISILFVRPRKQPPNLLSFLSPLSMEVWVYMMVAYVGVSCILYSLARLSPYEWDNPYPCVEEPEELENQFTLLNSLWFTIGSLMQQGSDIAPKAVSTRMVAGMWWFFTLIMISSYTANLAAFLTVENLESPINNVEELAGQSKIKYGAYAGGSTVKFFQNHPEEFYRRMYDTMVQAKPSVFTPNNQAGVKRVQESHGLYAFFMESSSIEFNAERKCDITQVGGLLDSKGYGIALPKKSPYRSAVNGALLKVQEQGKLHILKSRWWKEKRGGGQCADDGGGSSAAAELGLANVGGVFVVLVGGMFTACFIAACELLWTTRSVAEEEGTSFGSEVLAELKFVVSCHGSTKPARKKPPEVDVNSFLPLNQYQEYGFPNDEKS